MEVPIVALHFPRSQEIQYYFPSQCLSLGWNKISKSSQGFLKKTTFFFPIGSGPDPSRLFASSWFWNVQKKIWNLKLFIRYGIIVFFWSEMCFALSGCLWYPCAFYCLWKKYLRSPKKPSFCSFFFLLHLGACQILVSRPEIEPRLWQWKCRVLSPGLPGRPQIPFFRFKKWKFLHYEQASHILLRYDWVRLSMQSQLLSMT